MKTRSIYSQKSWFKFFLLIVSILIGGSSLLYTHKLVNELSREEQKRISIWADATQKLFEANTDQEDLNFFLKVIESNTTIPTILTDENYKILAFRNFDSISALKPGFVEQQLQKMKLHQPPLEIIIDKNKRNYCFYSESILLRRLTIYPYIQLFIIIIFIIASYYAFSSSRKAEQNKVWVGLSRETAHQLGTPISSLIAWVELLKENDENSSIVEELDKDVKRLEIITERFSNIGSVPQLTKTDFNFLISNVVNYMQKRIPSTVSLSFKSHISNCEVFINSNLFTWVLENLIKNSLDASGSKGKIEVVLGNEKNGFLNVDVIDNGKGISRTNLRRVFKPGFTSKSRGWGLGLSLAKRIIVEYHKGKIFVLNSELNKGTTFRILIPFRK
jgi:signal transduction histidine kinase